MVRVLSPRYLQCGLRGALALFGLILGHGTAAHKTGAAPHGIPSGAQSGDLIFRKGTEPVSDLVRSLDDAQGANAGGRAEFSHVGILIAASDLAPEFLDSATLTFPPESEWLVLHATPSEVAGRPDSVVIDTLHFFTSPELSTGHAVYHVASTDAAQRRAAVAAALAQLGQPFSLTDETGTYCTELPHAAWLNAGVDLGVRRKRLAIFLFAPRDFLFPSALMASPKLERLGEG